MIMVDIMIYLKIAVLILLVVFLSVFFFLELYLNNLISSINKILDTMNKDLRSLDNIFILISRITNSLKEKIEIVCNFLSYIFDTLFK